MAFDGLTIANLVSECRQALVGGRIYKIAQPETDELLLTIKTSDGQKRLLLSADASLPLIYLTEENKQSPMTAPNFCMLLRKHLESRRVASIRLSENDRIFTLEFGPETSPSHALVVELTGAQSNVFLVDLASHEILGAVWRDSERGNASREIHDFYLPPCPPAVMDKTSDRFSEVADSALFEALEASWTARDAKEALEEARAGLKKRLNQGVVRLERRMDALYRDLAKVDAVAQVRREADLLSAYAWQLAQGSAEARLPDFETRARRREADGGRGEADALGARASCQRRAAQADRGLDPRAGYGHRAHRRVYLCGRPLAAGRAEGVPGRLSQGRVPALQRRLP